MIINHLLLVLILLIVLGLGFVNLYKDFKKTDEIKRDVNEFLERYSEFTASISKNKLVHQG